MYGGYFFLAAAERRGLTKLGEPAGETTWDVYQRKPIAALFAVKQKVTRKNSAQVLFGVADKADFVVSRKCKTKRNRICFPKFSLGLLLLIMLKLFANLFFPLIFFWFDAFFVPLSSSEVIPQYCTFPGVASHWGIYIVCRGLVREAGFKHGTALQSGALTLRHLASY